MLPGFVMFGSIITEIFNSMRWYTFLQEVVVPYEARFVAVMIKIVGIQSYVTPGQEVAMILKKGSEYLPVSLEWNCLGWQSILLLAFTFTTGLRGNYTAMSKIETIIFGILGTLLINLLRMAFIVSLAFYWSDFAALIIHDYFAMLVTLIWIVFFWWFSYRFILEPKVTFQLIKNR